MSPKSTWLWLLLAAALFGTVLFVRHTHHRPPEPKVILPNLDPAKLTFVQVRSGPKAIEIRAQRTNDSWLLTEPLVFPADPLAVTKLLTNLAQLTPAAYLTETELRSHPNADEDFGLAEPQVSIILTQSNYRAHVLVGNRTAPGDQVFVKVVAREGLYVVDADLLQSIPRSADDWRDRDLLHLSCLDFDRLAVTNSGKSFVVGRDSTNSLWRMVWPLFQARADGTRIEEGLDQLAALRVQQFVTDDPKADLDSFGLQTPELELSLEQGTNLLADLQFGKSPTNHADQVYARRTGQDTIVTVPKKELTTWRVGSVNDFRDPHLLEVSAPIERIVVHGQDQFTLQAETNNAWRVLPGNFPGDDQLVTNLLSTLTNMAIVQFTKDVATPLNWPEYGLATPARQYLLESKATGPGAAPTNQLIADLSFGFGTNQPDKVFVRRADEASVYAVSTNDFARLPSASWEMRQRRFWTFTETNLAGLTIQERGKTRELLRHGDHEWSLGPGSQGIIEEAAVEESVHNVLDTPALDWVAVGQTNRTRCGFTDGGLKLSFHLKDGRTQSLEFGGDSPGAARYAAVMLDNELWIMELPWALYRYVQAYLSLPPNL